MCTHTRLPTSSSVLFPFRQHTARSRFAPEEGDLWSNEKHIVSSIVVAVVHIHSEYTMYATIHMRLIQRAYDDDDGTCCVKTSADAVLTTDRRDHHRRRWLTRTHAAVSGRLCSGGKRGAACLWGSFVGSVVQICWCWMEMLVLECDWRFMSATHPVEYFAKMCDFL